MPEHTQLPEPPGAGGERRVLTGWGLTAPSAATVVRPADEASLISALALAGGSGAIARGLGRSYGDAAQCAGGTVIDAGALDRIGEVHDGTVTVGAGASIGALMARALPAGWFVPVTPGTRQVSLGGALAADIHGKNHHREGSLGRHVDSVRLATPSGVVETGPDRDPELFWATAGGMGLTGVVTSLTVRMLAVETTTMVVDTRRYRDLDAVMDAMVEGDHLYRYSVAWVDGTSGRGRSILTSGDHARLDDLPPGRRGPVLVPPGAPRLRVPAVPPVGVVTWSTTRAFNEAWFRRAPASRSGELQPLAQFFHPLDGIGTWNRLYGRRGFVQYQFVVPEAGSGVVGTVLRELAKAHAPSFLAVLKRFGQGTPGPLTFPMPGWTLAVDIPVGPPALGSLFDRFDEMVVEAGGRVYLAKDARLRPELLRAMYPRLDELAAVRRRVDPDGVLRSDLARRLGLT